MIHSKLSLDYTNLFLDEIFTKVNVFRVSFVYFGKDVDSIPAVISSYLSKNSQMCILQSCFDTGCMFTFVTYCDVSSFKYVLRCLYRFVTSKYSDVIFNYYV